MMQSHRSSTWYTTPKEPMQERPPFLKSLSLHRTKAPTVEARSCPPAMIGLPRRSSDHLASSQNKPERENVFSKVANRIVECARPRPQVDEWADREVPLRMRQASWKFWKDDLDCSMELTE